MKLSVGIDRYPADSGYAPLRFARRDASLFSRGLFIDQPKLDLWDQDGVSRSEFLSIFAEFISNCASEINYFYFAGHSFIGPSGTHLVFSDSKSVVPLSTSVAVNDLLKLTASQIGKYVFVLDSCRNVTDNYGYDFFASNSCVLYSTSSGAYRYEDFSISRSFPAIFERALRYESEAFLLSDLCGRINSLQVNPAFSENTRAEIASDVPLSKSNCRSKSALFETTDITKFEIFTGVKNQISLSNYKSSHKQYIDALSDRYSGFVEYRELDALNNNLFALTLFSPRDFITYFLRDTVQKSSVVFYGAQILENIVLEGFIADGSLDRLPSQVVGDEYFLWEGAQFLFRRQKSSTIIIPVKGNTEIGIHPNSEIFSLLKMLSAK